MGAATLRQAFKLHFDTITSGVRALGLLCWCCLPVRDADHAARTAARPRTFSLCTCTVVWSICRGKGKGPGTMRSAVLSAYRQCPYWPLCRDCDMAMAATHGMRHGKSAADVRNGLRPRECHAHRSYSRIRNSCPHGTQAMATARRARRPVAPAGKASSTRAELSRDGMP